MRNKILILSMAAALLAGGFTATQIFAADSTPGATASKHGRWLERAADKLNLTADQRTQIKAVLAGEKETLVPLVSAVHDARKGLRTAIRASDASEASVRAASASVAAAEANLAVERMKLYGKIAPLLTDSQRQQLAELQSRADEFTDRVTARLGSGLGE
jgi:Spy/CpxP family protein refolding chaperone